MTLPLPGKVLDGKQAGLDLKYSSETVSKFANWDGFFDPESGIASYKVDVYINNVYGASFEDISAEVFEDHTLSMKHNDELMFRVHALNGAESEVTAESNGFTVDLTPPVLQYMSDNNDNAEYQKETSSLTLKWSFIDKESIVTEYRVVILEKRNGITQKFWPADKTFNLTTPVSPYFGEMSIEQKNLTLKEGVTYALKVTALNGAGLSFSHETKGVTVDSSPPNRPKVNIKQKTTRIGSKCTSQGFLTKTSSFRLACG